MQNDWLLGGWYSWILIPLGIFELFFFRTWYFHGIKIFDHQKEMYVLMWPGQWVKLSCYYTNVTVRKATKDLNIILWVCVIKWSSVRVMAMVFNATFNNISVISWWSDLLVGKTGVLGENHRPVASRWPTLSHNVVLSTPRYERDSNSQLLWRYALM